MWHVCKNTLWWQSNMAMAKSLRLCSTSETGTTTVDGRNPKQPPGMYKNPVNNGINYQPQLVSSPDFWSINSSTTIVGLGPETHWETLLGTCHHRWEPPVPQVSPHDLDRWVLWFFTFFFAHGKSPWKTHHLGGYHFFKFFPSEKQHTCFFGKQVLIVYK